MPLYKYNLHTSQHAKGVTSWCSPKETRSLLSQIFNTIMKTTITFVKDNKKIFLKVKIVRDKKSPSNMVLIFYISINRQ